MIKMILWFSGMVNSFAAKAKHLYYKNGNLPLFLIKPISPELNLLVTGGCN
jgi:hypothetical protein